MTALASGPSLDSVKFRNVGDSVSGRIIDFADVQEREFADNPATGVKKGDPKTWPDGNPVMQVRITLETRPGDQASRMNLYVSGKRMKGAVRAALAGSGAEDISPQSELSVTFTGYEGVAKCYTATYTPFDPTA